MAEVDVNTLDTNDLIIALKARRADLSPDQRKRLSEIAAAQETRGDVSATIKGRRTAPLSAAEDANTAPDRFARLKQTLTAQYAAWAQGVDGNKPTLEQALTSFSPEQLGVANTYATPYLLMIPVIKENSNEITGYEPFIAEGKQEMDPYTDDNVQLALQNRIAAMKQARREDESGMTRALYDPLFEAAKEAGKPIDRQFYTMLEDDYSEGDPRVPFARSGFGRPFFDSAHAVYPRVSARFRSTVRGNVLSI